MELGDEQLELVMMLPPSHEVDAVIGVQAGRRAIGDPVWSV